LTVVIGRVVWLTARRVLHSGANAPEILKSINPAVVWGLTAACPVPWIILPLLSFAARRYVRYGPKKSRKGLPMRRLSEKEEDCHLLAGQIAEEKLGSADYDVWLTADGQELMVLRYGKDSTPFKTCPACNFETLKTLNDVTIVKPTYRSGGQGERHSQCQNCSKELTENYSIPRLVRSSSSSSSSHGGSSSSSHRSSSFGGGRSGGGGAGGRW
jgi:uncharacterized protein